MVTVEVLARNYKPLIHKFQWTSQMASNKQHEVNNSMTVIEHRAGLNLVDIITQQRSSLQHSQMITWRRLWHLASLVKIRQPIYHQEQTMETERIKLHQTFSLWHPSLRLPFLQVALSVIMWQVAPTLFTRPLVHLIKSTLQTIKSRANFSSKPTMHTFNIVHQAKCYRASQTMIIIPPWLWSKRRMSKIRKIILQCNQLNKKSRQIIMEKLMKRMMTKKRCKFKRVQQQFKMIKRLLYQSALSSLLILGLYFLCRARHHSPKEEEASLEKHSILLILSKRKGWPKET